VIEAYLDIILVGMKAPGAAQGAKAPGRRAAPKP
jgi:hypothetical protein